MIPLENLIYTFIVSATYDETMEKERNLADFSNSDAAIKNSQMKTLKRKHPVTYNNVDLNSKMQKIDQEMNIEVNEDDPPIIIVESIVEATELENFTQGIVHRTNAEIFESSIICDDFNDHPMIPHGKFNLNFSLVL